MPMNPEDNKQLRDAFLKQVKAKYRVIEPFLGFDSSSTQKTQLPIFDPQMMTLKTYQGEWGPSQVTHLVRRLKFGVSIDDLRHFSELTMEAAVDELLTEAPQIAPPVNDYNSADEGIYDPNIDFGETWVNETGVNGFNGERLMSLKRYWIDNIINQGDSITEKILLFWHNHLVTEWFGVFYGTGSYKYLELLRKYQMGDIKQLVKEMTYDITMLYYLNGAANHKVAPDENYARELQELFTIGKGPNAKYTEGDVQMAARILTGWTVTYPDMQMVFDRWRHDETDKQFSEFYGNRVIEGRSGEAGKEELDDLLDMIFENEECALFLSRQVYKFFVYPEINDEVETNIIQPMAQLLRDNNYVLKPVLDQLFKSEHFYNNAIKGSFIKDPVNHLLGLWRTLKPKTPDWFGPVQEAELKSSMLWSMHNIGMQLGDPPNVAGWQAYYQQPTLDKGWITTNTITSRGIQTDSIVYWGFWSPAEQIPADFIAFCETLDNPEDPIKLIDQITLLLFGHEINDKAKERLKAILLSGQAQDYYWTDAWFAYQTNPSDQTRRIVEDRLKWMMQRVLQYAEYHLM